MRKPGRKFLIDGSMAKGGGGFTYIVNILPELARQSPDDTFRIVCGDERVASSIPEADNIQVDFEGRLGFRERLGFTYRGASKLAKEWGADLYFSTGEMAAPNMPCPSIVSFRNPNIFTRGKGQGLKLGQRARLAFLNAHARLAARRSERVMFVSEDSAEWIGDSVRLPEHKRAPIHHGIDPAPWRSEREKCRTEVHERPYILSVSSVYAYKNYVRLIEAYAELAQRHADVPDLVIIGDAQCPETLRKMHEARDASGVAEWIHILGEVPYQDIRRYYAEASLFVFPSYLETFGHPLLEAMASDLPLVAADIPVFREVAGDAAFYADPFDTTSLANAMDEALFRPGAAELLVKRGRERLREFTWKRTAANLMALFEDVLRDENPPAPAPLRLLPQPIDPTHDLPMAARVAW